MRTPTPHAKRELPIMRIHRLITTGVTPPQGDAIVIQAASKLTQLSLRMAPKESLSLCARLSQASQLAKSFTLSTEEAA